MLEVHLMTDAHAGRDGGEVLKGALAPLEEGVTLAVALVFEQGVDGESALGACFVDLHRVVDDQLGGDERVDARRVAAELDDGIAHGAEIDDGGHAGEVLHEHAGGHVGDFAAGLGLGVPVGQQGDVFGGDVDAIFAAQKIFEQNLEAEGQPAQVEAARLERRQAVDRIGAVAGVECGPAGEAVHQRPFYPPCARMEQEQAAGRSRMGEALTVAATAAL